MNLNKIYDFSGKGGISDIFSFSGDCGVYDGYDMSLTKKVPTGFKAETESFEINADVTDTDGVFERVDTIKNTSDKDIIINHYAYRFCLEGGEYDVYTQLSNWQNENEGEWNKLNTKISVCSESVRSCDGAAPFVAVWNRQSTRGIAFHLLPEYAWEISVTKKSVQRSHYTTVEISVKDNALSLPLKSGEEISFAPVVYYEFSDKLSIDCHKLHSWFTKKYPRKSFPVFYNTWLTFFDKVDIPLIFEQIREAKDIGCEYFVIDAGWFGKGHWADYIGTWVENEVEGYKGRLKEVSDEVHRAGMKFGLWLEPERALKNADSVKEHPDYYFTAGNAYFVDFANKEAREYITEITCGLIEKYNVDHIKFDFNEGITYDCTKKGFYEYRKGHIEYVKELKRRYPDIYLENCASGGIRMELEQARYFDSFWFTDNQSPYEGLTIIKNSLRRLPPYLLERWLALVSRDGFVPAYGTDNEIRTLATNNGTWDSVVSVTDEYVKGFFSGGSVGLSCDLTKLEEKFKKSIKEFIREYKKDRDFWMNASARILCDTDLFLAVQYEYNKKIKVVVTSFVAKQEAFTFYPVIENKDYTVNGEKKTYKELTEDGITINEVENNYSYTFNIE